MKLANPASRSKTYCSILKTFLNNIKNPCIPPLFHQNKFITNFKGKTELFNTFFANKCTLLNNSIVLPNNLAKLTNKSLNQTPNKIAPRPQSPSRSQILALLLRYFKSIM